MRQPRYAALGLLMIVVATICVGAGSWQIARLAQKAHWNAELRANAHAAPVPLTTLVPLTGGPRPSTHHIQFHTVTVTGSYDATRVQLVTEATVDNTSGYYVLTPLNTADGTLLVVRGFIASPVSSSVVPPVPAPPPGTVQVTARVEPGETRHDDESQLTDHRVATVNPVEQAARLHRPVFDAYAELLAGQPGVGPLTPIPSPDLSNPAGGAVEPQHVAYIIQWFLFAGLALAAPIVMARHESAEHPAEPDETDGTPAGDEQRRQAKLADRYGRAVR